MKVRTITVLLTFVPQSSHIVGAWEHVLNEWTKAILILKQCAEDSRAQASGEKGSYMLRSWLKRQKSQLEESSWVAFLRALILPSMLLQCYWSKVCSLALWCNQWTINTKEYENPFWSEATFLTYMEEFIYRIKQLGGKDEEEEGEIMKKDRKGRRKAGKGRRKRQGQEVERARVRWMTYNCISSLRLCNYVNQELTIKVKLICVVLLFFLLSNERVLPRVILILSSLYLYTYLLIYYLLQGNSSQIHLSNSVLYLCLLISSFKF